MTTYTIDPPATPAELAEENARLRLAISHLTVYARAVIECRDNGGLQLGQHGHPAYRASSALSSLEEFVCRTLVGDWQPLTREQINLAWDRHAKRPLWGEETMTRGRFDLALNDLLWHPDRRFSAAKG